MKYRKILFCILVLLIYICVRELDLFVFKEVIDLIFDCF